VVASSIGVTGKSTAAAVPMTDSGERAVLGHATQVTPSLAAATTSANSAVVPDHLPATSGAAISSRSEGPPSGRDGLPEDKPSDARLAVAAGPSKEALLALRARGDALFGSGDIVSARLFYERAAEGGDGQAALQLGESYDPEFLKRAGIVGIRGDSATAKRWYEQASGLGASEAQILLNGTADR
jgi:TPR repeat protein